jgi:hypothetical protein
LASLIALLIRRIEAGLHCGPAFYYTSENEFGA